MAQRKKAKSPVSIPVIVALILLCLTLISIHFSSGIVARYVTTAESGDSARVIKFEDLKLEVTGGGTQYIIPGVPLDWNAKVTFGGSESATFVFVEVTGVAAADENSVTPCKNGPSWAVNTAYWKPVNGYPGVYYHALAPNTPMTGIEGELLFNGTAVDIPDTTTAVEIAAIDASTTTFRASVVQSNGFAKEADPPAAAWKSLEDNHGN